MKVLIVDDLDAIRKKFVRILEKNPKIETCTASNGYEAVSMAVSEKPDVILMDIEMETPLAGIIASNTIYQNDPAVKIIILTVHEEDTIIYKAFQAGIVDYLFKNSPEEDIAAVIQSALTDTPNLQPVIAGKLRREFKRIKDKEDSMIYILNIIVRLTPTEIDILKLLHAGMTQKEVADIRFIELSTIKSHVNHILKKFGKKRTSQVLACIQEVGLFSLLR